MTSSHVYRKRSCWDLVPSHTMLSCGPIWGYIHPILQPGTSGISCWGKELNTTSPPPACVSRPWCTACQTSSPNRSSPLLPCLEPEGMKLGHPETRGRGKQMGEAARGVLHRLSGSQGWRAAQISPRGNLNRRGGNRGKRPWGLVSPALASLEQQEWRTEDQAASCLALAIHGLTPSPPPCLASQHWAMVAGPGLGIFWYL